MRNFLTFDTRESYKTLAVGWKEYKTSVDGIQIFFNKSELKAVCFNGRRKKATWLFRFKTEQQMILRIEEDIKEQYDRLESKRKMKEEKARKALVNRAKVHVGDIFYTSWGYDQTNIEFFQVVERVSPSRVKVQQIRSIMSEEGYMCAQVAPAKDSFYSDETKTCTIDFMGNISKADGYGNTGYTTEKGKSYYKSWYA